MFKIINQFKTWLMNWKIIRMENNSKFLTMMKQRKERIFKKIIDKKMLIKNQINLHKNKKNKSQILIKIAI